jgi:hypothetical protein
MGTPGQEIAWNDALRIDVDGDVGFGVYAPSEKMHVSGNIRADGSIIGQDLVVSDGIHLTGDMYFSGSLSSGNGNDYIWHDDTLNMWFFTSDELTYQDPDVAVGLAEDAFIAHYHSDVNMDHFWHDDTNNKWHLVSDASLRSQGNGWLTLGTLSADDGHVFISPRDANHGGALTIVGQGDHTDWILDSHQDRVRLIAENAVNQPVFEVFSSNSALRVKTELHGDATVHGTFNAQTKHFLIDHPVVPDEMNLVHASIEGPRLDLIYRGKVDLIDGTAEIDLDEVSRMSPGTFEALTRHAQVMLQNDSGWDPVRGTVEGGRLKIVCRNETSNDSISWLVIAERDDADARDASSTDSDGRLITEVKKQDASSPRVTTEALVTSFADDPAGQVNGSSLDVQRGEATVPKGP